MVQMNVSLLGGTQGILGEPWRQGFVSELLSAHPALGAGALRSSWQSVRTLKWVGGERDTPAVTASAGHRPGLHCKGKSWCDLSTFRMEIVMGIA